jgi:hypothetical protein
MCLFFICIEDIWWQFLFSIGIKFVLKKRKKLIIIWDILLTMFLYLIICVVSVGITQLLECHGYAQCSFNITFADWIPKEETWKKYSKQLTGQENVTGCRNFMSIDYGKQLAVIDLSALTEEKDFFLDSLRWKVLYWIFSKIFDH